MKNIVLTGFMASGKSTIARELARITGFRLLDTDKMIEAAENMSCEEMKQAVAINAGRALLEASGNVTQANIRQVAETGVDIISLGALTHSVTCFDISMRIRTKA